MRITIHNIRKETSKRPANWESYRARESEISGFSSGGLGVPGNSALPPDAEQAHLRDRRLSARTKLTSECDNLITVSYSGHISHACHCVACKEGKTDDRRPIRYTCFFYS